MCCSVDFSLPAERVIRELDQVIEWRGAPIEIRCDNGPEYVSVKLVTWANKKNIRINCIQPGKPQKNAYIERYNRTVRYDWFGQNIFDDLEDAQNFATKWMWHYNNERLNMALGSITPTMKLQNAG